MPLRRGIFPCEFERAMLDLIILVFLIDNIGKSARKNGMNVLRWRMRLFFGYFFAEIGVAMLSLYMTHNNLMIAAISGFLGGILAAVVIFQWFKKEAWLISRKTEE